MGITTTSRSESMNAWLKRLVDHRTRMSRLFRVSVLDTEDTSVCKSLMFQIQHLRSLNRTALLQAVSPLLKNASNLLTSFAFSKVFERYDKSALYCCTGTVSSLSLTKVQMKDNENKFFLTRVDPVYCSCGYPASMGLPYEHVFTIATGIFLSELPINCYLPRWRITSSNSAAVNSTFNFTPEKSKDVFSILDSVASTSGLSQRSRYLDVQNNLMVVGKLLAESSELHNWIDACLSGRKIIKIPLPIFEDAEAEKAISENNLVNVGIVDPVVMASRQRKRHKDSIEISSKRGPPIPMRDPSIKGRGRPKGSAKINK